MKKIIAVLLALLMLTMVAGASDATLPRLVDEADILTPEEEKDILRNLNEISERQEFDVVVVTLPSLDGASVTAAADDFYDYNGYGYGAGDDGILFLVAMEEREYATSTYGFGIQAFTDYGQDVMLDDVAGLLSDGDYYNAFLYFAFECDDYITQAKTGAPYDIGNEKSEFEPMWIFMALIVGVIAAFIYTGILKAQLNSVRKNDSVANYMRPGSMNLTVRNDMFLYRNVTRTARPKDTGSSSGGGSSTRISSSGRSHGGRSGRF